MSSYVGLTIYIICNLIENVMYPLFITDLRQGPHVRVAGFEPARYSRFQAESPPIWRLL